MAIIRGGGLTGPPPKAHGRLRRNKPRQAPMRKLGDGSRTTSITAFEVPKPPENLSNKNLTFWQNFWTSDLSLAADPKTDIQAMNRLFSLYQERDELEVLYRADGAAVVRATKPGVNKKGKLEKPRIKVIINPVRLIMAKCDGEILRLEDRFGLNPVSRLRLGITFGAAAQSMAKLNSQLDDNVSSNTDTDDFDPREAEDASEI